MKNQAVLTFDVDMVNYIGEEWKNLNEMEEFLPEILNVLSDYQDLPTTWFLRADRQIESFFGSFDYLFENYNQTLSKLKKQEHEVGWHYHAYKRENNSWKQETNEDTIIDQLKKYRSIIDKFNITSFRSGWGYHTNKTMQKLPELGLNIDSSAIPRPQYEWEETLKDWRGTPQTPYYPSVNDYRCPGNENMDVLEIPISTTSISAPYDSESDVLRYLNCAYKPEVFKPALKKFQQNNNLVVTISHPYDFFKNESHQNHPLYDFSLDSLRQNINELQERTNSFLTITDLYEQIVNSDE